MKLRKKRGLTQKEIADKLHIHYNTVSKYENNTRVPPQDTLVKLAMIYNTSTDYILGINDRQNVYIDDLPVSKQNMILDMIDSIRKEYESEKARNK